MICVLYDILNCAAYLDDVAIYSDVYDQPINLLECLFARLSDASLVMNLDKREFGKDV